MEVRRKEKGKIQMKKMGLIKFTGLMIILGLVTLISVSFVKINVTKVVTEVIAGHTKTLPDSVISELEDAEDADEIFKILMGTEVEPRRQFIQENAKLVKRLDV